MHRTPSESLARFTPCLSPPCCLCRRLVLVLVSLRLARVNGLVHWPAAGRLWLPRQAGADDLRPVPKWLVYSS
jgi:hypothetical protein